MEVIRASHYGMCFGVRDAIALVSDRARSESATVLGDLVHNQSVLEDLRRKGVRMEREVDDVETNTVVITAHGASERTLNRVRSKGLNLVEATCPLVHFAHKAVARLVSEGYHPVIIGKRDHVEVRGLTEDLSTFDVVLSEEDVASLPDRERFGVAAQTTQPLAKVERLVQRIRERFPSSEVRFLDTVCRPTKQRQSAAEELARRADVVVVIGGAHSNNTRELANTCRRFCARVHQVQGPDDVEPAWFAATDTVGLTAGTSTPDTLVDQVEARIQETEPV